MTTSAMISLTAVVSFLSGIILGAQSSERPPKGYQATSKSAPLPPTGGTSAKRPEE